MTPWVKLVVRGEGVKLAPKGEDPLFVPPFSNQQCVHNQGDKIGRIFAYWAMVYLGQFLSITKEAENFVQLFSSEKVIY
jgi:hypothetical protein